MKHEISHVQPPTTEFVAFQRGEMRGWKRLNGCAFALRSLAMRSYCFKQTAISSRPLGAIVQVKAEKKKKYMQYVKENKNFIYLIYKGV